MKVETELLKTGLSIVQPALATKEIMEQTTSFVFRDGQVFAYNDEICIVHEMDIDLEGIINAEELYKFVTKIKSKEIDITLATNEIVMKAGRSKVGFALKTELLLPIDEELGEREDWQEVPEKFLEASKFAIGACSTDMSDPKITCVHIHQDGIIEATDNYRVFQWAFEGELPIETTLVPASSMKEVLKIQPDEMCQTDGWIHFRNETTTISCRVFAEEFMDTSEILETKEGGVIVEFPDGVNEIIEKAEIISQKQKRETKSETITVSFKGTRLLIESESEAAWFKESVPLKKESEKFSFSITPYLLKDILKETNECEVFPSMLRFEGEEWLYVSSLQEYKE